MNMASDIPSVFGTLQQILQKQNTIQFDLESRFLHLQSAIENLQIQVGKLRLQQIHSKPKPYKRLEKSTKSQQEKSDTFSSINREVLQENLEALIKDIDLNQNSDLLDDLLTGECLTSDEASEIIHKPNRKDQVRKLIIHIGRKSNEKFNHFIENMQKKSNYPHLASKLLETYNKKRKESSQTENICICCLLKRDVPVKDVIDKLYSKELIHYDIYEFVSNDDGLDDKKCWNMILTQLQLKPDHRKTRHIFQEALARKYEHISASISNTTFPDVICRCKNPHQLFVNSSWPSGTSGSMGDVSTTSEMKRLKVPVFGTQNDTSVCSTKSSSSNNINFENIPNTVAWLDTVTNRDNEEYHDDSPPISITVNEASSMISQDFDSVSTQEPMPYHDNSTVNYKPSFAGVVSGKLFPKLPSASTTRSCFQSQERQREFSLSSSRTTIQLTKEQQDAESLSEIGTLFLSKSETQKEVPIIRPTPSETKTNKPFKRNSKVERHSLNIEPNTVTSSSLTDGTVSSSSDHSTILHNVFFEEQRKIHGENMKQPTEFTSNQNTDNLSTHTSENSLAQGESVEEAATSRRKKKNRKKKKK